MVGTIDARTALSMAKNNENIYGKSSCIEERKELRKAEMRKDEAEVKLKAVKKWLSLLEREIENQIGPVNNLASVLDSGIPTGLAQLAARQHLEIDGKLLGKRDIGPADPEDLIEPQPLTVRRPLEALPQGDERPLADAEHEIHLVLEVDVQQRARQARAAGDLIHGERLPADAARDCLGRVQNLRAPALLLLLSTFGQVIHGLGL